VPVQDGAGRCLKNNLQYIDNELIKVFDLLQAACRCGLTQVNFSPMDGKIFPTQEQGLYSRTNEK
jgi:hypothetical protein